MKTFNLIHLQAEDKKFLTDGKRFVKSINIGQGQSVEDWTEVDESVFIFYNAKKSKIIKNDELRDNALISGVEYKGILFDSDTDQKINLLANISSMEDEDTITWFGMNNEALICTKVDLLQIGELIKELHTFCWTKNAEIKAEIAEAETVEEVNDIEIDYEEINEDTADSDN